MWSYCAADADIGVSRLMLEQPGMTDHVPGHYGHNITPTSLGTPSRISTIQHVHPGAYIGKKEASLLLCGAPLQHLDRGRTIAKGVDVFGSSGRCSARSTTERVHNSAPLCMLCRRDMAWRRCLWRIARRYSRCVPGRRALMTARSLPGLPLSFIIFLWARDRALRLLD